MAPKKKGADGTSKKNEQKKKKQNLEDKTFGLKNKNKSKKVQMVVKAAEKSIMNSGDPKQRKMEADRQKKKADAKNRKKAMKDEQDALFGEALLAVAKKGTTDTKGGKVEAKGRDADDEGKKKAGTSRAMKMMFQMDAQEMDDKLREDPNYVPTLEDEIELERQAKVAELKKSGLGTPITEASFAIWQDRKRKIRSEAARKMVEKELKKKKGGKGLGVLSGRDLYEYKKSLFDAGDQEEEIDTSAMEPEPDSDDDENGNENGNGGTQQNGDAVEEVAAKVEKDLFLEGDDDDLNLDDLEDD